MIQDSIGKVEQTYLKSAISKIYGDDDDFVILGLTGRTGSGCSTAAKILQSEAASIKHSLNSGENPLSNEERKERIIYRYFGKNWTPFLLVQVRAVITTFLLDYDTDTALREFGDLLPSENAKPELLRLLQSLKSSYVAVEDESTGADIVNFYTVELPTKCEVLREIFGESGFVKLYQTIGKNIRLSGAPYSGSILDGKFFTIAERIHRIITRILEERKKHGLKTFIVIDAIRSPLEAIYFQGRFACFFLLAVSAPDADRIGRLRSLNYSEHDIKSIDMVEYTTHDFQDADFYSVQDIQACLQRADLYVSNPNIDAKVNQFQGLANQLIKFISLIRRPGIITPSAFERCMQIAYTAKLNSGCISRQVGAVVTDNNFSIRSIGWNDVPHGHVPCNLRSRDDLLGGKDGVAYSEFERKDNEYLAFFHEASMKFVEIPTSGRNKSFCFKSEYNKYKKERNQVHTRSLHAEENAFLQISKYGLSSIEGGVLFTTASPCELCSKKACQLGISKIYYIDPYPGIAISHILMGGKKSPELILFSGAIGRAFHKLYTPIVPYKDELNALAS